MISIASLPGMAERTIICDGFSKTYAMTGWRLGFGIMPEALAERIKVLLTHSIGCTATFTQYAGIEAVLGAAGSSRRDGGGIQAPPRFLRRGPQRDSRH